MVLWMQIEMDCKVVAVEWARGLRDTNKAR